MKKITLIFSTVFILLVITTIVAQAGPPTNHDPQGNETSWAELYNANGQACTKIQSGTLLSSDGETITTGYDDWGYNYQGHMFNGLSCNVDRNSSDCGIITDSLIIKWNDAWLANVDCDGDGLLDRHYGFASYIGSGAWLTNHQAGTYLDDNGQSCDYNYFVKIVAAPADATLSGGVWYAADGTEIGPAIWGEFAVIQEVSNDPCFGSSGLQYASPDHSGFGGW